MRFFLLSLIILVMTPSVAHSRNWNSVIFQEKEYNYAILGAEEAAETMALLNEGLDEHYPFLGEVSECRHMVKVRGGTQNISYGGVCKLHDALAFVCDDKMTVAFSVHFDLSQAISESSALKFVIDNCWGG